MSSEVSNAAYDYVIVGAGSAGCVLASRLSEDPNIRVCLLEAGGPDKHPLIKIPMGFAFMGEAPPIKWAFETVPQQHLNGRRGYQPRGRVLGGSSSINAMIYIRGTRADYDRWAVEGATGWAYDDVLPYFKKSQNQERGESEFHSVGGGLNVADLRSSNPLSDLFIKATEDVQLPRNDDFNGADQEGVGYYQVTQRNGRRCSAADAFLGEAAERPNLEIISHAMAQRVLIRDGRAYGVEFKKKGGEVRHVEASGEVLVCAGAFQSPQLLMLSGIGPGAHLKDKGIDVVADRPGVGENLQDHADYCLLNKSTSPDAVGITPSFSLRALPAVWSYLRHGTGALTSNLAEVGGFLKTSPDLEEPDIQLHFVPGLVDDHGRKLHFQSGVSCHICVLRPKSRGTVRLDDANPQTPPLIDPKFFADPDDLDRTIKGARLVLQIFDSPVLKPWVGKPLYMAENADDAAMIEDLRARADTIYHPVGTCRMGSDEASVVDPGLRVRGVTGLRVVDASIMPRLTSGNTNAPSIMIGEKAADLIKEDRRAHSNAPSNDDHQTTVSMKPLL